MTAKAAMPRRRTDLDFVSIDELHAHPLFACLPYKFLEYHDRTVVRRTYPAGKEICRENEYGSTAFLIINGQYRISIRVRDNAPETPGAAVDVSQKPRYKEIVRDKAEILFGEMSCLSHQPRSATITADSDDCELWEIRRNYLDALYRNRGSRRLLDDIRRKRTIPELLENVELLNRPGLSAATRRAIIEYLLDDTAGAKSSGGKGSKLKLVRVDPARPIFEQGALADALYFIRIGHVKVARRVGSGEQVLDYLGPGKAFGEIGLLTAGEISSRLKEGLASGVPGGFSPGVRTASCSALDHVELLLVRGEHFQFLLKEFPDFRDVVEDHALSSLAKSRDSPRWRAEAATLADAVEQGLYEAQKLLVLDLEKCTRCDECTKACAGSHGGVTRLIREGLRYGTYLVATSCRSCQDPHCLYGCPVDAIHRRPPTDGKSALEIRIEPWCIGCGVCADNCPYGNINIIGNRSAGDSCQAVTCDLCRGIGVKESDAGDDQVRCVYACPHDAAHRMSGASLIDLVRGTARLG